MGNRFGAAVRRSAMAWMAAWMGLVGSASATLIDRGGGMIYDDMLNITWVQDASLCVTLNNCVNREDSVVTGGMSWNDANTWAANLVYGGYSDWRLPYASASAGAGPISTLTYGQACTGLPAGEAACRDNEMAYMFYYNLDGTFMSPETGTQIVDGVPLNNIQSFYWSGTESNSGSAWYFVFDNGYQTDVTVALQFVGFSAWAVRSGDVLAPVPEPASLLLIGVGMLGLVWTRRRSA